MKKQVYVYAKDKIGHILGYFYDTGSRDIIEVKLIAMKSLLIHPDEWVKANEDINIDLRKIDNIIYYHNYEEFFNEYFEAII